MSGNGKGDGWGIRLLEFVVRLLVPEHLREEFVGDLLEEWSSRVVPRGGKLKAFAWLCSQLLRSLTPLHMSGSVTTWRLQHVEHARL